MGPDAPGTGKGDRIEQAYIGHSFLKGMLATLSIYLSTLILVLVPIIGAILALTLVPYLASSLGTRKAQPRLRIPISICSSAIWSLVETAVIIAFMSLPQTPMGFVMERIGQSVIVVIWTLNLVFGVMGALRPWMDPFKVR